MDDERYASAAEYHSHVPWCKARSAGGFRREACTCDAPQMAAKTSSTKDMRKSNHLCVRCEHDCDCDGLHMMTDCVACADCRFTASVKRMLLKHRKSLTRLGQSDQCPFRAAMHGMKL